MSEERRLSPGEQSITLVAMDTDSQRLEQILLTMEVPPMRRADLGWLMRNLAIRNSEHPDFEEAKSLIRKMNGARRGWK